MRFLIRQAGIPRAAAVADRCEYCRKIIDGNRHRSSYLCTSCARRNAKERALCVSCYFGVCKVHRRQYRKVEIPDRHVYYLNGSLPRWVITKADEWKGGEDDEEERQRRERLSGR